MGEEPKASKSRVYIFCPCYGGKIDELTNGTIVGLTNVLTSAGMFFGYGSSEHADIVKVRNYHLTHWYDVYKDSTHILFVDADNVFDAKLALDMLAYGKPVVGVLYPKRGGDDEFEPVVRWKKGGKLVNGFMDVLGVGGGCLLVRRDAVDDLIASKRADVHAAPDDKYIDWKLADKIGVNRVISAFDPTVAVKEGILSDDFSFCQRFINAGGEIWATPPIPQGMSVARNGAART